MEQIASDFDQNVQILLIYLQQQKKDLHFLTGKKRFSSKLHGSKISWFKKRKKNVIFKSKPLLTNKNAYQKTTKNLSSMPFVSTCFMEFLLQIKKTFFSNL